MKKFFQSVSFTERAEVHHGRTIKRVDPKQTDTIEPERASFFGWLRLGTPEGELAIAQAVVYMACAPKSNALYKAYNEVRAFIAGDGSRPVRMRLRNAPTKLMKELGYGEGYRYAHDEPDAYAAGETYLPDGMKPVRWYEPTDHGVEQRIRERLQYLRSLARNQGKGPGKT